MKFSAAAFQEYNEWIDKDKDIFDKIKELIKDISREPFKGLGKPEPLTGIISSIPYWRVFTVKPCNRARPRLDVHCVLIYFHWMSTKFRYDDRVSFYFCTFTCSKWFHYP
ncbi:MAG: type II toxin-antitoxin system YoeB family toxin [Bacteroidota bacterium]|nr:type II toxin-antitoxin system YoeB family toxin [Bacteroidota bacterium]